MRLNKIFRNPVNVLRIRKVKTYEEQTVRCLTHLQMTTAATDTSAGLRPDFVVDFLPVGPEAADLCCAT